MTHVEAVHNLFGETMASHYTEIFNRFRALYINQCADPITMCLEFIHNPALVLDFHECYIKNNEEFIAFFSEKYSLVPESLIKNFNIFSKLLINRHIQLKRIATQVWKTVNNTDKNNWLNAERLVEFYYRENPAPKGYWYINPKCFDNISEPIFFKSSG